MTTMSDTRPAWGRGRWWEHWRPGTVWPGGAGRDDLRRASIIQEKEQRRLDGEDEQKEVEPKTRLSNSRREGGDIGLLQSQSLGMRECDWQREIAPGNVTVVWAKTGRPMINAEPYSPHGSTYHSNSCMANVVKTNLR